MKIYSNTHNDRFSLHVLVLGVVSAATGVSAATLGGVPFLAGVAVFVVALGVMILDLRRFDLMVDVPAPGMEAPRPLPPFAMKGESDAAPATTPVSALSWSTKAHEAAAHLDAALAAHRGPEKRPRA